jgi:hypothetical protein
MAKLILRQLADLEDKESAVNNINLNSEDIEAAIENTLSRDGTSPNQMNADLDMNGRRMMNLPYPNSPTEPLRKGDSFTTEEAQAFIQAASDSADAAATSATNAESSATSASGSASAASTSATNAANSATNAANSATSASSSASSAGTSATNAADSATSASTSASSASTSETNAASSASSASTSATNAANSASAASTSETNAASSASAASTSATSAANSATKASEWAEKGENLEVEPGKYSALHHSAKAAASAADAASAVLLTETTERTANYTLALDDAGKVVPMNSASALTLTVPPNSSVAFSVGTTINVYRVGAGAVTIAQGSGVTVRNAGAIKDQYGEVSLRKRATDEWVLAGNVS